MINVTVLYFAALRDLVRAGREVIVLPEPTTVERLSALLIERHPVLAGRLGHVRLALNEVFVDPCARVDDGDVVALIPPVAGG